MSTKTQWPAMVVLCLFSTSTLADGVNVSDPVPTANPVTVWTTTNGGECDL